MNTYTVCGKKNYFPKLLIYAELSFTNITVWFIKLMAKVYSEYIYKSQHYHIFPIKSILYHFFSKFHVSL